MPLTTQSTSVLQYTLVFTTNLYKNITQFFLFIIYKYKSRPQTSKQKTYGIGNTFGSEYKAVNLAAKDTKVFYMYVSRCLGTASTLTSLH